MGDRDRDRYTQTQTQRDTEMQLLRVMKKKKWGTSVTVSTVMAPVTNYNVLQSTQLHMQPIG